MIPLIPLLAALTDTGTPPATIIGPYLTDPQREGITIRFETRGATEAQVRIAEPGQPERVAGNSRGSRHVIRVHGLKTGTSYRYRLFLNGQPSGDAVQFRTAPPPDAPFSFVVMGDTRSEEADHRSVIDSLAGEAPDFVMNTGDLVEDGGEEAFWQSFFDAQAPLIARAPIVPAMGNHEAQNQRGIQNFTRFFGVAPVDNEMRFAFTYGNSRFLVMDTNLTYFPLTGQTEWLEEELRAAVSNPDIRHIFVMMHHSPYATGPHGGNRGVRAAWAPLFAAYGVEVVFAGHDHLYERLEKDGVRYVISGGGGGPIYSQRANSHWEDENASILSESSHHYVRVHVSGENVEMAAKRIDGSLIESVRWRLAQRRVRPRLARASRPATADGQQPRHTLWLAAAIAAAGAGLFVTVLWRRRAAVAAPRTRGS